MKLGATANSNSMQVLVSILALTFIALVVNVVYVFQKSTSDQMALQTAAEMRASSYRVVSLSREATAGQPQAFASLDAVVRQMNRSWIGLKEALATEIDTTQLTAFESELSRTSENAGIIASDKDKVVFLNEVAETLNATLPQLQQEHTQVVEILLENDAPADQVAVAQNQTWLAERIGRNVDKMLAGGADAEAAADQFNRDANLFGRVLDGMKKGDRVLGISRVTNQAARESLDTITERFEFVNNSIQEIFEATPVLFAVRQANNNILDGSPALLEQISDLSENISNLSGQRTFTNQTALFLVAVAVFLGAAIGWVNFSATRGSLKETAETNEQNQDAILRLLDEIGDLGDGDLTSHATVTEDFTGAIADSINYAIDQLRILVSQIQDTSENVSAAAHETRATALQLTDSANHQSEQIAGVTESVTDMAQSINQVSENASESAKVAEQSVSIAGKGAGVVRDTISGMDTIREQIQDTSKRIKRLGESSQEIGDIVSLINDIADQTNILALNAAIQASMAGDAGRGFAVVADEVQRLAERSADATKQISALVKAIQNDTNEAVSSMEQTTVEVVKGASLAQNAGVALEEIETVSVNLEKLILDISVAAQNQSATAGRVSQNMDVIQDITSQTLLGTETTASSTAELAELAVSLRDSVSGFKLPETNDSSKAALNSVATTEVRERSASAAIESKMQQPDLAGDVAAQTDSVEETFFSEGEPFHNVDLEVAAASERTSADEDFLSADDMAELESELLRDEGSAGSALT